MLHCRENLQRTLIRAVREPPLLKMCSMIGGSTLRQEIEQILQIESHACESE